MKNYLLLFLLCIIIFHLYNKKKEGLKWREKFIKKVKHAVQAIPAAIPPAVPYVYNCNNVKHRANKKEQEYRVKNTQFNDVNRLIHLNNMELDEKNIELSTNINKIVEKIKSSDKKTSYFKKINKDINKKIKIQKQNNEDETLDYKKKIKGINKIYG